MNNHFQIKTIRDFGSLISDSFYYVRHHFKLLGKSVLYFVVPLITVAGLLIYRYFAQIFEAGGNPEITDEFATNMIISSFSGMIFSLLAMTALAAVVLNHIKLAADDSISTFGVEDIWDGFKSDFFIIMLISIGVYIASFIGLLFFVIPGIFIAVKLVLTSAVYVLEDTTIGNAFSRSWRLIKNHWWLTFGVVLVITIMVSLMSYILILPMAVIAGITGFSGLGSPEATGTAFGILYTFVTSLSYIFYTVFYICLGLHYYNLVERKEGKGLEERISQIDESSNTNSP